MPVTHNRHRKTHPSRLDRPTRGLLLLTAWLCLAAGSTFAQVQAAQPGAQQPATVQGQAQDQVQDQTQQAQDAPNQAPQSAPTPEPEEGAQELQSTPNGDEGAPAPESAPDTQEATEPQPQPAQPEQAAPAAPAQDSGQDQAPAGAEAESFTGDAANVDALEFALEEGALEAREGGETVWRLAFPEGSGSSTEPLLTEGRLYLGHGNSVLRVDPATGTVQNRWVVSGPVESVERVNELTTAITVRLGEGLAERFSLREDTLQDPVRFGLEPEVFGYLEAEAQVPDPAARLAQDPTNPWLYLAVGLQEASDPEAARATFAEGIEAAETFYDLAGLAQVLEENGERTLAEQAFAAAMADFAARGYDPRLLTDPTLEAAYNFPLEPLRAALAADNDISAGFWARNLYLAAPDVPGTGEAFSSYAALISDVASREEIAQWQSRARGSASTGLSGLDRIAGALGGVGWYAALAVLAAILALHLTLVAKYWKPQSSDLERARIEKGRATKNHAAHLFAIRYYTISEKLVLVLMFASVLALAALADWHGASTGLPTATRSGTLASREAQNYLEQAELSGARGAFIRGYAAQVSGGENAQAFLQEAGDYAPAVNNLGALTGDTSLYSRALELDSGLAEARYNLGETPNAFPFFAEFRPGEPVLAVPTQADFQNALSGTWNSALGQAFTNPWTSLRAAAPFGLHPVLWNVLQVLFLFFVLVTVLFIFIPRPRSARNAPRTLLYHLLALLIPGSGLADEAWGVFLIIPWAVVGLDVLAQLAGWPFDLGIGLQTGYIALGVIYLVNTVAFFIELFSYRQRMRELELNKTGRPVVVTKA